MDVSAWLQRLGLGQYEAAFRDNEIDGEVLPTLTAEDLKELGIAALGHRRRLLTAIAELAGALQGPSPAAVVVPAPPAAVVVPAPPASTDVAERRQLTVMFCDLVGSTALSARLDPEDMREVVGSYHRCCANLVERNGGFVAKYMGDGVLVYFGYPQAHEHDAERAVRAGLAIVEAAPKLVTAAGSPLHVRVGIATGLVVVGDLIGSGEAQERGIVGETPNLAARLQALAEPNMVVIADSTRRLLGNLFELQDLGAKDLKGITGSARAWAALRASSVESRFEALHTTGLITLVGREEEFESLLRRWSKAKTGEGQVVLLSGEPGIGKSRLTAALLERVAAEPHTRLRYFCSPQHTDSALYPIISQVERAAGFVHDDTSQTKLDKLDALLAQSSTPREDASLFAEMLSLPNDGRYPTLDLAPQPRRQRTLEALTTQVEVLSRSNPVLMVFEDVHWIDPTSLEELGRTVDRLRTLGVLLIVTYRPEFEPPWIGQPHVTALTINRLCEREIAALIDGVIGNKPLPANIRQDIIDRTDGIPLFVEEITKSALEAVGEGAAERAVAAIPSPSGAVPASLHASLMARLDRLGPAKEVAQIGAVIGREFSHELLAAVANKPEAELGLALGRVVRAGLLFQQGKLPHVTYLFKHALVQDAAYSTLLRDQRQLLHSRIAAAIEGKFPEITATQPGLLAQHYAQAGMKEPALKFWTTAGDVAEHRAMSREAAAHYRSACALLSSPELSAASQASEPRLFMKLGNALLQAEGYNSASALEAYENARVAARKLDQLEDYADASIGMGPLLFGGCRYRQVLKIADELASDKFNRLGPLTRVRLLLTEGVANFGVGEYKVAWEQTTRACALDDSMPCTHENPLGGGDPAIVARGYAMQSGLVLGYGDHCQSLVEDALGIARKRNHAFTVAWALLVAARFYNETGRFAEALSSGNEAIECCERYGFVARMGTVLLQTGAAYCRLGETERGLADSRRGLELWRKTSSRFHMSYFLSEFADCLLRANHYDEADRALREAEQVVAETDERSHASELLRLRGRLLALSGSISEGTASLWQAVEWARSRSLKLFELRALRDLASIDISPSGEKSAKELRGVVAWFPKALKMPDLQEARLIIGQHLSN
jgi:class 3 adenylate cyclase/tetratricopeptide (TPR) repeat protein